MRVLVLVLLAANLLYLGWELNQESRQHSRDGEAALPVPPGTTRLELVGERSTPPPRREPDAPPGGYGADADPQLQQLVAQLPEISLRPLPGDARESCFSFGPLPDERQALWLGDWFRSRQAQVRQRTTQETPRQLFWIYLAPENSPEGAEALMHQLQAQGVRDYRLIRRGDLGNAVSLGLYSSQAAVNARLSELTEKGYRPVVVPYADVSRFYWLDVRVTDDPALLEEMFQGYPARYQSVPVQCSEIAMALSSP